MPTRRTQTDSAIERDYWPDNVRKNSGDSRLPPPSPPPPPPPPTRLLMACIIKAGPLEAIFFIFGRSFLNFFCSKGLENHEKWHHFYAQAQQWSPLRRKNVEKAHLASTNLTFWQIAKDKNGFRRLEGEGQISKRCLRLLNFCLKTKLWSL